MEIPTKWRLVGIAVGMRTNELDAIEQQCRGNHIEYFANIYDAWMNNPAPLVPFTWGGVVQVLERSYIKERALAVHLIGKHSLSTGEVLHNKVENEIEL